MSPAPSYATFGTLPLPESERDEEREEDGDSRDNIERFVQKYSLPKPTQRGEEDRRTDEPPVTAEPPKIKLIGCQGLRGFPGFRGCIRRAPIGRGVAGPVGARKPPSSTSHYCRTIGTGQQWTPSITRLPGLPGVYARSTASVWNTGADAKASGETHSC